MEKPAAESAAETDSRSGLIRRSTPGLAITAAAILLIEVLAGSGLPLPDPTLVLALAVAFAAFHGGAVPGFLSAGLALAHRLYHFVGPGDARAFTGGGVAGLLVAAVALPAIAAIVVALKRREERLLRGQEDARIWHRVHDLVEDVDGIIWEADVKTYRFTFVSRRAEAMLGYPLDRWGEEGFRAGILHPEDRERVRAFCEPATREGRSHQLEYRVLAADGRVLWIRDTVIVIKDEKGRPRLLRGVMLDITERRKAEEALRGREAHLRSLLEQMPGVIWSTDANLRFTSSLGRGLAALGHLPDEVVGRTLFDYFRTADPEFGPIAQHLRALEGKAVSYEMEWAGRTYQSHVQPLRDAGGAITGTIGGSLDITERKRAERLVAGQKDVLEKLASGAPLDEVFATLIRFAEDQVPGMLGSILLVDERGMCLRHGAAPSLPDPYNRAVDGLPIGPAAGSCGTAAHRGVRVVVEDVLTDPLWEKWRDLAASAGLRSCWSEPILSSGGKVLGTFALYHGQPMRPGPDEITLIRTAASLAAIAIERRRAEESLERTLSLLRATLESTADGILVVDPNGKIVTLNQKFVEMWRIPHAILESHDDDAALEFVLEQLRDPKAFLRKVRELYADREAESFDVLEFKDGRVFERYSIPQRVGGSSAGRVWSFRDVTARRRAEENLRASEEQLRQSQKMEAIGRLAGGVAHDFNNLLTVITGHCSLLQETLPGGDPARATIEEIGRAATRAAGLTKQLLAFSRRQVLQPQVLDLNAVLAESETMLRRVIGEDVDLITRCAPGSLSVRADRGQIEQVILNLAVNARDSMPRGGKLILETSEETLDQAYAARHVAVMPGPYAMLAVSDTGIGMEPDTQARIFEPFFTTKEMGKGTGLGLATVYGIVKQSGGNIWVYSQVGRGTTFKIYLPRVAEKAAPLREQRVHAEPSKGVETILLVEDETLVRSLVREVLERRGYSVIEATGAGAALNLCKTYSGAIDLLVTDVVMPGMGGRDLAHLVASLRPRVKVLYMSGYTESAIALHGLLDPGTAFIQKPFTPDGLAHKVRAIIDGEAVGGS